MKTNIPKKITAFIILGITVLMLVLSTLSLCSRLLYELGIYNDITLKIGGINELKETTDINWDEKYPFLESSIENENGIDKMKELISKVKEKIENRTSKKIIGYNKMIEISYLYDKTINYKLCANNDKETLINVNDYLIRMNFTLNSENDTQRWSKNVIEFNEYLSKKGINFLYVQSPHKMEKNNNYVPKIYENEINKVTDELLSKFDGKVNYLDLREKITKTGKEYLDLFFKTDHHWRPETGLWATGQIIDKLNNDYNYQIDKEISNIENYNVKVYKDKMFGSEGKCVTNANAKLEDMPIITPKFETLLTVEALDYNFNKTGTMEETLIDYDKLNYDNIYNCASYATYALGNRPLIQIYNKKANNDIKILSIVDSYVQVITPFLSLGVKNYSVIDLRHFTGSVKSYIEEYKPDIVIVSYYPGTFLTEEVWNYE